MVALVRRLHERPKLDEECPAWARDLMPLSEQEQGLGVPCDRIPPETLEALHYFFPAPVPPKRERRSAEHSESKKYARTCGLAVFLACLPYALARQLDLFADTEGLLRGEIAVLSLRKLADLAKKVGMSYDRVQRWMTLLVTLGFIWRFRDGKRTLYVIPLTAYTPRPSAEGVRNKLTALIHSQFVEVEQDDGQVVRVDRNPEFTNLLLEIRTRFELRYQLAPSLDLDLLEDPAWEKTLRDLQQALPGLTRDQLYTIVPIVVGHLLQQQGGAGKDRHFVLKRNVMESTMSIEITSDGEQAGGSLEAQLPVSVPSSGPGKDRAPAAPRGKVYRPNPKRSSATAPGSATKKKCSATESTFDGQLSHSTANTTDPDVVQTPTHDRVSAKGHQADAKSRFDQQIDVKSRFDQKHTPTTEALHDASPTDPELHSNHTASGSNLPLPGGRSLTLTLGSPAQQDHRQDEEHKDAKVVPEQEQKATQESWKAPAAEVARILADEKSLKFYESVFRQAKDEQLVRAVFLKTLHQGKNGGFTRSGGAYFKFMWEQWRVYRTYAAACAKWNHWGNQRDPKGIPPNIQKLVSLYEHDSYTQVASYVGYSVVQAELESSPPQNVRQTMTLAQAEELVEALHGYARWYLRDPQIYQEPAYGPDTYMVDVLWPNGEVAVLATCDDWVDIHQRMLTLPQHIDAWFEAERVRHLQEGASSENGMSAREREDCVRTALAMYAYYGQDATSLFWEDLVALGKPLLGKRVESVAEEAVPEGPASILIEKGKLYVRMDDGDLVSLDAYQRAYVSRQVEERQEEQAYTEEGARAVLRAELLLGLHIGVLRTFGLSVYRTLVAGTAEAERELPHAVAPEEGQALNAVSGMPLAEAWQYLRRLQRVLEPRFYQIRWRPVGPRTCCIVVESRLSGQAYTYHCADQIEQALAELSVQEAEEACVN